MRRVPRISGNVAGEFSESPRLTSWTTVIAPTVASECRFVLGEQSGTVTRHASGNGMYSERSLSNSCLRASFPALLAVAIVWK